MTGVRALLTGTTTQVPVVPDAETARQWARTELADPVYHQQPSLLSLLLEWLAEQYTKAQQAMTGLDTRSAAIIVASLVVVAALAALLVAGPVARTRRARRTSLDVFGDDTRSAAQLRAAADAHAVAGRWGPAVLDRFRAVLRSLEERVLLEPRPGRTAHEASELAGARLPDLAADLVLAGRLFDDVCYGDAPAAREDDAWLRDLDARVAATRPMAPAEPAVG